MIKENGKEKVLVIGATGFLGKKCYTLLKKEFNVAGTFFNNPMPGLKRLDIRSNDEVEKILFYTNPDIVIHTASMIDIEKCEKEKKDAWEINVLATKNIVQSCKKNGSKLVYISSDYIFNGNDGPYYEDSEPDPLNYYGMTKLEAERIIEEELFNYAIIRPAVLDGFNSFEDLSFFNTIYSKLRDNRKIELDDNLIKYPVLVDNIVMLIKDVIINDITGVFHIGSKVSSTRFGWAQKIAKYFKIDCSNLVTGRSYSSSVIRPNNVNLLTHHKDMHDKYFTESIDKSLEIIKMQKDCTFNYFYSFYPEDNVNGQNIAQIRINAGKKLSKRYPCEADMVVPIPESGIFPAIGYSISSGIPYVYAVIRNESIDRTLFERDLENRVKMVNTKLKVIEELVYGKDIVLVDEAILSGTTTLEIVSQLKSAGAKTINIRIPFPIVTTPCLANNMPNTQQLLTEKITKGLKLNSKADINIEKHLGVNSVEFLNEKDFLDCFEHADSKCVKCIAKRK